MKPREFVCNENSAMTGQLLGESVRGKKFVQIEDYEFLESQFQARVLQKDSLEQKILELEAKLKAAVEALELIHRADRYCLCRTESEKALKKIRGEQ